MNLPSIRKSWPTGEEKGSNSVKKRAYQIFNTEGWQVAEERPRNAASAARNESTRKKAKLEMMSHLACSTHKSTPRKAQETRKASKETSPSSSMRLPGAHMSRLLWLLSLLMATCSGQEVQPGRPGAARIRDSSRASAGSESLSSPRTSSTGSSAVQNVTAQNGQSVLLHCLVEPPGDFGVSWFRGASEPQLLTSDSHTVIDDERFVVRRGLMADDDWALQIKNLDKSSDAGLYQCQSHSEPPRSQFYQLNIVEPQAHIAGAPDMAVKLGAPINLTCLITQVSDEMPFIFWYHNQQVINKRLSESRRGKIVISKLRGANEKGGLHSVAATLHIFHSLLSDSGNYSCEPPGSNRHTSIYVHVLEGSNKRLIMFQNDDQQYAPASTWDAAFSNPAASSQQTNSAISVHVWRLSQGKAYALFVGLVIFSAWYQLIVQTPMLFSFLLLAIIGFFLGLVTDNNHPNSARQPKSCPSSSGQVAPTQAPDSGSTSQGPTEESSALHLLKSASSASQSSLLATATSSDLSATNSPSARSRPPTGPLTSPSSGSTSSSASTGYNSESRSSNSQSHRKQQQQQHPQESHLDVGLASNVECDMIELVTQPTALRLIMDEFSSIRSQSPTNWSPISACNSLEKASVREAQASAASSTVARSNLRSSANPISAFNWHQRPTKHSQNQLEPHYSTPTLFSHPPPTSANLSPPHHNT